MTRKLDARICSFRRVNLAITLSPYVHLALMTTLSEKTTEVNYYLWIYDLLAVLQGLGEVRQPNLLTIFQVGDGSSHL